MNDARQVILIDDDQVTNFLNKHYISTYDKGIQVTAFTDAQEVLKMLQSGTCPAAIFLDINMPEMDGWQFLDECQKMELNCKIFMLSSSIDPVDINRSKQYQSVSGFLSKPLTNFDLQDYIG
jgi:CheY-like chemotaxis protein